MIKRIDYKIISNFIENKSSVLDLGCGDGSLLAYLIKNNDIKGEGIEISEEGMRSSIERGLAVHHGNIDEGLKEYGDNSFDYVILSQTLQMTNQPVLVINEMLRVGKYAIISFPNFGHYAMRFQLALYGRMPVTKAFPFQWYDTPNIRHTTINDFKSFCLDNDFYIEQKIYLRDFQNQLTFPIFHNIRARLAIFVLRRKNNEDL